MGLKQIIYLAWPAPLLFARRILGANPWPLERGLIRLLGRTTGHIAKSLYGSETSRHPLGPIVDLATRVEEAAGIFGDNEYLDENTARRRVHTCPYCRRENADVICRFGEEIGKEAFDVLVPGSCFVITKMKSRGDEYCEYLYTMPPRSDEKAPPAKTGAVRADEKAPPAPGSPTGNTLASASFTRPATLS